MKIVAFLFVILIADICRGAYVWNGIDWEWVDEGECCGESRPVGLLSRIRQNALGKEISDKVSQNVDAISHFFQDVEVKAESMFQDLSRKVEQDAEVFRSQLERHLETKVDETLQVIQGNPAGAVQSVHEQLTQSAGAMRNQTELFIQSLGQSVQTQLSAFWESLTKGAY